MKTTVLIGFVCFVGTFTEVVPPTWGQPPANEAKRETAEQDEAEEFTTLPSPLDGLSCNLLDLEKTGHLRIIRGTYSRTKLFDDPAMIWTVEVVKPLTCGHARLLVHDVSDVRFHRDDEDYNRELFATRLFYESWLDAGAVNREILHRDERFDVWIDLTEAEAWKLNHEKANRAVFGKPHKRYHVDKTLLKWK